MKKKILSMMVMLSGIILLVSAASFAATNRIADKKAAFDVVAKIYIDRKLVSSPRVICYANKKASVMSSNEENNTTLRYELVARHASNGSMHDAIEINFDVLYKNKNDTMHVMPKIIVYPKHEGVISFTSDSGHSYEMRIIADMV